VSAKNEYKGKLLNRWPRAIARLPAKIVIGVRATTSRGERLNPLVHLRRNLGVWTDGIALGFAPLSIFTMIRQFKRVSGRREAIYDEKLHVRMRSGSYCGIRAFIAAPLFIGIALLIFATLLGSQ